MRLARIKRLAIFMIVIVLILLVKYIYLHTAEQLVDIQELPPTPLRLVAGLPAGTDFGTTRLYAFTYITNAIFMWIFGFNVGALKLTSVAFFLVSCLGMLKVGYDWFEDQPAWIKWLPCCLIAFGPPVAQMWAIKNRSGFIETWAIFPWVLWLYGRWAVRTGGVGYLCAFGALCGIAVWAQPIAIFYTVPIFAGVFWQSFQKGWRNMLGSMTAVSLATLVGVMPLVALNFIFNFNTLKVIEGGEYGLGADTPVKRFARIINEGLPRIVGLKQQWQNEWVLPEYLSLVIFIFFFSVAAYAIASVIMKSAKQRRFDAPLVAAVAAIVTIAMNTMTSWGAFQGEPRRLLLLYVPTSLLVVLLFTKRPRWLVTFSGLWFAVSAYSNVSYVKAHPNGYKIWASMNYTDETEFLRRHGLLKVYTGQWTSTKIEFESRMAISSLRNPYIGGAGSTDGHGVFNYRSAAVFQDTQMGQKAAFNRMMTDLGTVGIVCLTNTVESFHTIYGCSRDFNIKDLPNMADQLRLFSSAHVIFDVKLYKNNGLKGFYGNEGTHAWTMPEFTLPFVQAGNERGMLCLTYGKQRNIDLARVKVLLDGDPVGIAGLSGMADRNYAISNRPLDIAPGFHVLDVRVPYFLPAATGSADLRSLGLPLETVSLVPAAVACAGATANKAKEMQ